MIARCRHSFVKFSNYNDDVMCGEATSELLVDDCFSDSFDINMLIAANSFGSAKLFYESIQFKGGDFSSFLYKELLVNFF